MAEYNEQCKKCFHFQVCTQVMKNQLFIREKMLKEENPKCEHFVNAADVVEVVMCKNCKHGRNIDKNKSPEKYFREGCIVCTRGDGDEPMIYLPTHYCSYGARMEGETNDEP